MGAPSHGVASSRGSRLRPGRYAVGETFVLAGVFGSLPPLIMEQDAVRHISLVLVDDDVALNQNPSNVCFGTRPRCDGRNVGSCWCVWASVLAKDKKGAIRDHGIVLVDPDVVLDQQCREVCCETNIDRSTTNEDRSRSGKRTGASHFYVWRDRKIIALFTASSCQF